MADNITRPFSWQSVVRTIGSCLTRFPLSVLYVVTLTAWTIALVWIDNNTEGWTRIRDVITYGLSAGALLSLTVYLWHEGGGRRVALAGPQLIGNLLLIADCVWLYAMYTSICPAMMLGHAAVLTALGVCVFSGTFTGTRSDVPCWNMSHSLITSTIVSMSIAIVMTVAINAIFATMHALLDFEAYNWRVSVWIVSALMIPVLIFMGRIPHGDVLLNQQAKPSRFLTIVTKFLFVPTVMVFYCVLYVYMVKIIISGQLPDGMVCWPVAGAILACMVIEYLLYPARMAAGAEARFENTVARWLPIALIPLLGLMSVSIYHRIEEYGVTLSRLYMATLNVWAYAACLLLFVTRARRFRWIPLTCAGLFLLTSVFPWANYANLTETIVRNELADKLRQSGVKIFPISQKDYNDLIDKQPLHIRNLIEGRLRYLQNDFGEQAVAPVVIIDTARQRYWSPWQAALDEHTDEEEVIVSLIDFRYPGDITIPETFNSTMTPNKTLWKLKPDSTRNGRIWFNAAGCVFSLNIDSVQSLDLDSVTRPILCLPEMGDSCAAIVTRLSSYSDHTYDIDGYLFKK